LCFAANWQHKYCTFQGYLASILLRGSTFLQIHFSGLFSLNFATNF
jgi:hypothetical protein